MRSTIVAAAFAVGALAVPYNKRDVVIDYDYVTVTDVVTVTAGAEATSVAVAADVASSSSKSGHWGHHWWSTSASSSAAPTSEAPAPSSSAAPTTASSAAPKPSSYQAPSSSAAPTTPTSTYVAPTTSSTSIYVPPTTSSVKPSSTKAASSSVAASSSAADSTPTSYSEIAKYHHNLHRANHTSPDIEWDDALTATAAKIAAGCVYAHNVDTDGGGYGQNIAAGVEASNISAIITDLFYNGEVGWYADLYGQDQPDMTNFESWGHFSQIVWKSTTKVGCATQHCPNGLTNVGDNVSPYFTVCNYGPPGNYANEYGANVIKPPTDVPTAEWNAGL
ncbi:hypothetical protein LTR53_013294 [Teratosphaeriaceae sp. CCFEE 6253]|nr:hypothetical protein LTR53_013294 [Teratosphaeriaceae sp. CCFEE 6253]